MVARRDPVDRVIDLVVAVPVSIAAAVRALVPIDGSRLQRAVGRNLSTVSHYARRGVGGAASVPAGTSTGGPTSETPAVESDLPTPPRDALAAVGLTTGQDAAVPRELPIEGYDQLSARQIVDRLPGLTSAELIAVERYERSHRRRQTVLSRIGQLS